MPEWRLHSCFSDRQSADEKQNNAEVRAMFRALLHFCCCSSKTLAVVLDQIDSCDNSFLIHMQKAVSSESVKINPIYLNLIHSNSLTTLKRCFNEVVYGFPTEDYKKVVENMKISLNNVRSSSSGTNSGNTDNNAWLLSKPVCCGSLVAATEELFRSYSLFGKNVHDKVSEFLNMKPTELHRDSIKNIKTLKIKRRRDWRLVVDLDSAGDCYLQRKADMGLLYVHLSHLFDVKSLNDSIARTDDVEKIATKYFSSVVTLSSWKKQVRFPVVVEEVDQHHPDRLVRLSPKEKHCNISNTVQNDSVRFDFMTPIIFNAKVDIDKFVSPQVKKSKEVQDKISEQQHKKNSKKKVIVGENGFVPMSLFKPNVSWQHFNSSQDSDKFLCPKEIFLKKRDFLFPALIPSSPFADGSRKQNSNTNIISGRQHVSFVPFSEIAKEMFSNKVNFSQLGKSSFGVKRLEVKTAVALYDLFANVDDGVLKVLKTQIWNLMYPLEDVCGSLKRLKSIASTLHLLQQQQQQTDAKSQDEQQEDEDQDEEEEDEDFFSTIRRTGVLRHMYGCFLMFPDMASSLYALLVCNIIFGTWNFDKEKTQMTSFETKNALTVSMCLSALRIEEAIHWEKRATCLFDGIDSFSSFATFPIVFQSCSVLPVKMISYDAAMSSSNDDATEQRIFHRFSLARRFSRKSLPAFWVFANDTFGLCHVQQTLQGVQVRRPVKNLYSRRQASDRDDVDLFRTLKGAHIWDIVDKVRNDDVKAAKLVELFRKEIDGSHVSLQNLHLFDANESGNTWKAQERKDFVDSYLQDDFCNVFRWRFDEKMTHVFRKAVWSQIRNVFLSKNIDTEEKQEVPQANTSQKRTRNESDEKGEAKKQRVDFEVETESKDEHHHHPHLHHDDRKNSCLSSSPSQSSSSSSTSSSASSSSSSSDESPVKKTKKNNNDVAKKKLTKTKTKTK